MLKYKISQKLIIDIGIKFTEIRLDILKMKDFCDKMHLKRFHIDRDTTVSGFEDYLKKVERY
jgi:hypothetical protein